MATLTGSRNMHHWTFTLNLNFATGMWKQTFHDDLECHKLMFEKISVQHVLSTHALMSKGPDQGRLKKGLGFSKWRVCLKNCSFWEAMHLMSQHVSASEILFSLLCYTWAPMYSNAYDIYIYMCVWHLLWEHQAGTFSVIFLAAKALAMVLLSSTSTSLSDIFLHWVWTLLHSWHHKPRHCKYIVKVLPTVGMFEIATLNLELNLCL